MNIKERIRKMGPFIALVVTFIVIAALNDSFVDPNNLKKTCCVRFPSTPLFLSV